MNAEAQLRGTGRLRGSRCWLAGLLAALGVFYLLIQPGDVGYQVDSVTYLAGAQSLAEGKGYRFVHAIGAPAIGVYPPLQSAYLACWWRLYPWFPANVPLLQAGQLLLTLGCVIGFYALLVRHGVPQGLGAALAALFGLSPNWFALTTLLYSDVLFTLLGYALLLLWAPGATENANSRWLVTGLGMALLYLTRTAATACIAAVVLLIVFGDPRRRWHRLAWFTPPVLLAVLGWRWMAGTSPGYLDYFRARVFEEGGTGGYLLSSVKQALAYLLGVPLWDTLFPMLFRLPSMPGIRSHGLGPAAYALMGAFCVLMAWLLLRGMRQDGSPLGRAWRWVMGCYLAQLMLWPYPLGYRAMAVLLPGACIWCWRGWSTFRGRAKPLLSALVVVFLAGNLVTNIHLSRREAAGLSQKGHLDELREVAAWLLRHAFASTQTAVGGEVPVFHLHHYTGRQFQEYIPASDARYAFSATPPPAQSSQPDLWLLTTSPTEAQPHQAEGRAAARTAFRSSRGHYEVYEAASKPRVPPP